GNIRALVYDNHEPRARQRMLALRALGIYRTLRESGVVEQTPEGEIRLTVDLQPNFALNQPLSPFALAAFELLDPLGPSTGSGTQGESSQIGTGSYALDMVSIVEATLDDPRAVL